MPKQIAELKIQKARLFPGNKGIIIKKANALNIKIAEIIHNTVRKNGSRNIFLAPDNA